MGTSRASGPTPAVRALRSAGVAFTEHAYAHDPSVRSFGLEAAEALGVDPARVFKTLVVDAGGQLVVGIVPVTSTLDLKAVAAAIGRKRATLADVALAERTTGYVAGGISPVGQRKRLPTVLDERALAFDAVYVSGGRRGLDVALAPSDLVRLTDAVVAAIAAA